MTPIDRRRFLQSSAALAASLSAFEAAATRARAEDDAADKAKAAETKKVGPNDQIRVAVIGVRGRGMEHIAAYLKHKDAGSRRSATSTRTSSARRPRSSACQRRASRSTSRTSAGSSTTRHRRRLDRHAQPLARPGHHLGLPGGQGRLRREAGQPQRRRRPEDGRGGPEVQPDRPGRHPVPEPQGDPGRHRLPPLGQARPGLHGQGALLQAPGLDRPSSPTAAVPEGLDYDLWTGPAEMTPFNANKLHYNWHWDLEHRQRRPRQPGDPPDGPGPLGPGQERVPQGGHVLRRPVRLQGRRRDPQHPDRHLRVRRLPAPIRGPRPADQRRGAASRSATSSTGPRASWPSPATPTGRPTSGPKLEKGPGGKGWATTSPTSCRPSGAATPSRSTATSRKATCRAPIATSATSPTSSAASSTINPSTESFVHDAEADAMLTRPYRDGFRVPAVV